MKNRSLNRNRSGCRLNLVDQVQTLSTFGQTVEDIKQLKVRNSQNDMVPMADFASVRFVSGPVMVMRYYMYLAAPIHAGAAPDTSSGQAAEHVQQASDEQLPQSMRTEYTEMDRAVGHAAQGSNAGRVSTRSATNHHDIVRLHPRCCVVDVVGGRRKRKET